jgi:cyanophycinase
VGSIALVGGDEFRPDCEPMDRALLASVARQPPRVVILPTAAARQGPALAAKNGERWFRRLGADARSLMVVSALEASDPKLLAALDDADLLYLTGGDPALLLDILQGSAFAEALRRRLRAGALLAGSSAGAMVLGAAMRYGAPGWTPTLGLAPYVAVLPHHDGQPRAEWQTLRASLAQVAPDATPLGIPTATACVNVDGGPVLRVVGARPVTIYAADGPYQAAPGDTFTLAR